MLFGMLFDAFSSRYFERFLIDVLVFRSVRKRPTSEICNTFRVKTNISQGARLRPRSGEGEAKLEKQHKKYIENVWKMLIFLTFLVPAGLAANMHPQ